MANRPFFSFDFRALWRSRLSARVPESQNTKCSVSQPGIESLIVTVPILEPWAKDGLSCGGIFIDGFLTNMLPSPS